MNNYPETKFEEIRATLPADLESRVLAILKTHVGREQRISRRDLVAQAFGVDMQAVDLATSTLDRQVRMALESLQDRHPVLSTSGGGGYYYASSADEIARYAAELDSRAHKLLRKSRRLVRQARRFERDIQLQLPL